MSARWRQGQEFEIEYADGYHHVMRENRHELGMEDLEGLLSRGPRKLGTHWGIWSGKRNSGLTNSLAARLNCPSAARESRTLRRSEWKSPMKRLPRTLAGYI